MPPLIVNGPDNHTRDATSAIRQNRMFAAVRDALADGTWVRGRISAEGRLVKPVAEPEISLLPRRLPPGDHHHSPGGTRQLMMVP